jgi:hypothetical protein
MIKNKWCLALKRFAPSQSYNAIIGERGVSMDSIVAIVFGLGGFVLIGYAFFKSLVKKRKSGNMYTPYDDMTRGTIDTNHSKSLEEDTRHAVRIEENKTID